MGVLRLDILLPQLARQEGVVWALVVILLLVYIAFGRLSRAFILGMAVLLGGLLWYDPLRILAHILRWWIFGLLAFRGCLFVLRGRAPGALPVPVPWTPFVLGALALLSCFWARSTVFSVIVAGTFVCTLLLCFVVAWRLMDTEDFLRHLCAGALVVALLMQGVGCLLGAVALVTGDGELIALTGVEHRFSGVMLNANGNGVFAAILWPVVLASPREYLGRLSGWRIVALIALITCVVLSGSRTAVGVVGMTTFVYLLYRFRAGAILTIVVVGIFGIVALLGAPLEEFEGSTLDSVVVRSDTLGDLGGRLERWEYGWDTAMDRPWFGHGWGASRTLDDANIERSLELGRVKAATNLHSAHVSLLVDLGFVGLGVFWLFAGGVIAAGIRILRAPRSAETTVSALFFASTLGMLANTLVHNEVLSAGSPSALLFWFSCALVIKQSYRLTVVEEEPRPAEQDVRLAYPLAGA